VQDSYWNLYNPAIEHNKNNLKYLYSTYLCFRNGSRKTELHKCIHNETLREKHEVQSSRWKNGLKGDRNEKEIKK
jgi:hypothetical protein